MHMMRKYTRYDYVCVSTLFSQLSEKSGAAYCCFPAILSQPAGGLVYFAWGSWQRGSHCARCVCVCITCRSRERERRL